ncbi:MAG: cyanophycin synthetase [Planctomycetota bacterium]
MEFRRIWTLRGPNYWANFPVLEAEVDLGDWKDRSSDEIPGFNSRLKTWLPSLIEHRCSVGERGGFFQRLERGTYLAHILEHVALELQALAGSDCGYGRARELEQEGVYHVALQFEEEDLGRACLEAGRELCLAAALDQPFDIAATIARLKELSYDVRLGPSTRAIVHAAKARGIPHRRLNRDSLVQLGHGARARRICTAESDQTSAIAETVAQDKELTRSLLRAVGVPVPQGRPVSDAEDAWLAAQQLGLPVVVKPRYGNHGRGVATNLSTRQQVEKAYAAAREESRNIMVEQFIEGLDHRLLVINGQLIAAAIRDPAHVIGDGEHTVAELVALVNQDPRRSDGHSTSLSYIKLDTIGLEVLAEEGFTPDSVPPKGHKVLIRRNGNLSTGGTATDVTDRVHPEVARRAIEAARVIGLDIAGVDVVAVDISRSLEEQRAGVVEVNAGPGLRMHIEPTAGSSRPVGEAIVQMLFGEQQDGRLPTIGVSGLRGATTAVRHLAACLQAAGRVVGRVDPAGLHVGDRLVRAAGEQLGDGEAARMHDLLVNPVVEAVVGEVSCQGIVREGLGYDRGTVGIVTWLGDVQQADWCGLDTAEKFIRAMTTVVDVILPTGVAVLNADDPLVAGMAENCRRSIVLFTRDPAGETARACQAAGRSLVSWNGHEVRCQGEAGESWCLSLTAAHIAALAACYGESSEATTDGILGSIAAAWQLGVPQAVVQALLHTNC